MIKRITLLLSLIFIFFLSLTAACEAKNSYIFSISGGTEEQRQYIKQALEESNWDWEWGKDVYKSTDVTITNSFPPYWDSSSTAAYKYPQVLPGDYLYVDDYGAILGVARYPGGKIWLNAQFMVPQVKGYIWEVPLHEAAHARVWFVWLARNNGSGFIDAQACKAWAELVSNVPEEAWETSWYLMPWEAHAEMHRAYYGNRFQHFNINPRTELRLLSPEEVYAFHDKWCYSQTPPPPPPPPPIVEQKISINAKDVYRAYEGNNQFWVIDGKYEGSGQVWWFPIDWGDFAPYGIKAEMDVVGNWLVKIPATSHTGPLLRSFKVVLYKDEVNQKTAKSEAWFDLVLTPFPDVPAEDWDMYKNIWYVKNANLMIGYQDGTFGVWDPLLKRQVYLIAKRAGLSPLPEQWINDYSIAIRDEVRKVWPYLNWNSERWDEQFLRSQFARLIGRTYLSK